MSTLKTGALRGTSGTADSIQLHASNQSVTFPGATTFTGAMEIPDDTVDIADLSATGTASATTFLRGDNAWAVPGGGKILQVVGNLNTGGGTSTTSTDWVETYITDTITPTTTGSKIAVFATGMGGYTASSTQGFANCTLGRNVNSEGWAYMGDSSNGMAYIYSQGGASGWYAVAISYLDTPTYTAGEAIEYSVFIKCNSNVSTVAIGNGNSHSPIILMEVAA